MSTQSRSIYTPKQLDKIAEDLGLHGPPPPSPVEKIGEAMDTAIAEAHDAAEAVVGAVATAKNTVPVWVWPLVLGYFLGIATFVLARLM